MDLFSSAGQFVPEKLTEARSAKGLNMSELARRIGVTRQAVSKYEIGQSTPGADVMRRLVEELDMPVSHFTTALPDSSRPQGTLFFRKRAAASKSAVRICRARSKWLARIVDYLDQYLQLPQPTLPTLGVELEKESYSPDDLEEVAALWRDAWGLGQGPLQDVALLSENHGIILSRTDFEEELIDAFSCWAGRSALVFLSNDNTSAVRSRHDNAHEVAHLLLHQGVTEEQWAESRTRRQLDAEADALAGAFLLPATTFAREVFSSHMEHLIALKRRWKVSLQAIIYRCDSLGIFSESQTLNIRKTLSAKKMRKHEPLDDEILLEEPRMLARSIRKLIATGLKSAPAIVADLALPPREVEALCGLRRGELSTDRPSKLVDLPIRRRSEA